MSFSTYVDNHVLDHVFLGSAFTQPTAVWVKLHVGDPTKAGTANAAAETTRKQLSSFAASSSGSKVSSAAVQWTSYPATETITHVSFWDASTGGNCLAPGTVTPNVAMVGPGSNILTINSGQITITLD